MSKAAGTAPKAAANASRAQARAGGVWGGVSRQRSRWLWNKYKAARKTMWRFLWMLGAAFVVVVVCTDAEALAGVGKALHGTAEAIADSAVAAAIVVGAGANATASVVKASQTALKNSASAFGEMWSGVDVLNVKTNK